MTVEILAAVWITILVVVFLTAATVTETWTEALRAGVLVASVVAALVALWWAVLA